MISLYRAQYDELRARINAIRVSVVPVKTMKRQAAVRHGEEMSKEEKERSKGEEQSASKTAVDEVEQGAQLNGDDMEHKYDKMQDDATNTSSNSDEAPEASTSTSTSASAATDVMDTDADANMDMDLLTELTGSRPDADTNNSNSNSISHGTSSIHPDASPPPPPIPTLTSTLPSITDTTEDEQTAHLAARVQIQCEFDDIMRARVKKEVTGHGVQVATVDAFQVSGCTSCSNRIS